MPTAPPSPEEMAAIAAAVELAWPRPVPAEDDEGDLAPAWRWSGRWWAGPVALKRQRPWS